MVTCRRVADAVEVGMSIPPDNGGGGRERRCWANPPMVAAAPDREFKLKKPFFPKTQFRPIYRLPQLGKKMKKNPK